MDIEKYTFRCHKIDQPPVLSGDLSLPPWSELSPVGDLMRSNGAGAAQQATRVWCAWDHDYFYVAFNCEDSDIRATMTERDAKVWQEEAAEFFVSPDDDLSSYFEFQFSPRNVVRDIRVENPHGRMEGSSFHGEWDCPGLRSATRVNGVLNDSSNPDRGWTLEVALPFTCLLGDGQRPKLGDMWRINFFRIYREPVEEFVSLSPTFVDPWEFHVPEYFAYMIFVS